MVGRIISGITDKVVDSLLLKLMRDPYTENLFELVSTTMKVTPLNLMETVFRCEKGKAIGRPFGSTLHMSPWDEIKFNPVYLHQLPAAEKQGIKTDITLGPAARKPLRLKIPIIITGMSYGGALSKKAKIALAKASTLAGTATNTGEGALLVEEREEAKHYIYQYHRGLWPHGNKEEFYRLADMIEIQVGQGAQAAASQSTPARNIDAEFREIYGLQRGEDMVIASRLKEVETPAQLENLVRRLKEETDGIPVAYKFGAGHYLEKEMDIAINAGVDVIVIDGAEAGSHAGQPLLSDDFGLPTLYAITRAADHLTRKGLKDKISLIASGGLLNPGHFLKAMALGADAVYIGTIAIMALVYTQFIETVPQEPPTELVLFAGKAKEELDVDLAAQSLANFLKSCVDEMVLGAQALGKESLADVSREDLVALTREAAEITGVDLGYRLHERDARNQIEPLKPLVAKQLIIEAERKGVGTGTDTGTGTGAGVGDHHDMDVRQ